jgi:formylglycine-generating enzyme required for sulfatase activity
MTRLLQISLFLALLVLSSSANTAAADSVGLTASAPANGRSVKTDQGFMVPYKMTIPGTEVTFEMVPIPGGKFKMGSPNTEEGREDGEGPQFMVELEPFWMGKYEVTWAEYRRYMALYGTFKELQSRKIRLVTKENEVDAITAPTELYDPSFTFEYGEDPALPAVTMTQFAAREYTKWLTAITGQFHRLPSEAEWEYACRAGSQTAYYFGDSADDLGDYAWYYDNSDDSPHKVGQKKPNAWGLYDMHGNVAEMVLDQKLADGFAKFASKTVKGEEALVWPTKLVPRVVKGGSWEDDPEDCRSAKRLGTEEQQWKLDDPNLPLSPWWFTSDPTRGIGFRIIRPLNESITRSEKERYWAIDAEETRDAVDNRMSEGRGVRGLVDGELPKAIKELEASR